ncbi:hypothetical protein LTR85_003657 [Meristemomyces frigidus]|nr:hypothetical protein LTR85_003657 [Meristemomyces frigidus]
MLLRYTVAAAVVADVVQGQERTYNSSMPSTAAEGEIAMHIVDVGKRDNQFEPNSISAYPGDVVSFRFHSGNHSVIQSVYGFACIPSEDITGHPGFYSGFMPATTNSSSPPTWNLTINDTSPVFYYCGAPGSCIDYGMVGVINPDSKSPLTTQIELAMQADYILEPGEPLPGAMTSTMSAMAATATTATLTLTATTSWTAGSSASTTANAGTLSSSELHRDNASSHLSDRVIAGTAVGAAAVGLAAAVLFFLFGRNRRLKRELERNRMSIAMSGVGELPLLYQQRDDKRSIERDNESRDSQDVQAPSLVHSYRPPSRSPEMAELSADAPAAMSPQMAAVGRELYIPRRPLTTGRRKPRVSGSSLSTRPDTAPGVALH